MVGLRECWIVDPDAATFEIIGADGETVQRVATLVSDNLTLRSPLLGDLTADPTFLFPTGTED